MQMTLVLRYVRAIGFGAPLVFWSSLRVVLCVSLIASSLAFLAESLTAPAQATPIPGALPRLSSTSSGGQANGRNPSISGDHQLTAFVSNSTAFGDNPSGRNQV